MLQVRRTLTGRLSHPVTGSHLPRGTPACILHPAYACNAAETILLLTNKCNHAIFYSLAVETREGVPFKPADLRHAGAHRARHIILLQRAGAATAGDEALSAAAAMSLATLQHGQEQSIVVQVPGERLKSACTSAACTLPPSQSSTVLNRPGAAQPLLAACLAGRSNKLDNFPNPRSCAVWRRGPVVTRVQRRPQIGPPPLQVRTGPA